MVVKYKQPSGLTVILEPVESVVSISAGLWVRTGSRHERADQYGYAHFVEHMLFKGTERYSARDIARLVDRVGGQHNAATNREYTCYYINVVSDYLDLALEILGDMYQNSVLDSTELDKEKNVIIEEIRMYEDTPDEYIHDIFMEKMFMDHPLSHSILGTEDSINSVTRKQLVDFYHDHYTGDNTILVISGRFDPERAKDMIAKYFSGLSPAPRPVSKAVKSPGRIDAFHTERDLEQVHFCLGTDGIRRDEDERWALYALSTILGGSMSSRLFQNIREKEGICYSIYSFHSSYSDTGVFGIYCASSPDKFARAVELAVKECRELLKNGVTDEELDDARTFMKGNLALSLESIEVRMGQLAKNEMTFGRYFSFEDVVDRINRITRDEMVSIVERIFRTRKLAIVSVGEIPLKVRKSLDLSL